MQQLKLFTILLVFFLSAGLSGCGGKKEEKPAAPSGGGSGTQVQQNGPKTAVNENNPEDVTTEIEVPQQVSQMIQDNQLQLYPELTMTVWAKDVKTTAAKIVAAGGKILFDPTYGAHTKSSFLVVSLPPDQLMDKKFVGGLGLLSAKVSHPVRNNIRPIGTLESEDGDAQAAIQVPIKDIGIPELQKKMPEGKRLGEGTVIAIIDTGVDASHPVFQDRVVYWSDDTQEGRAAVTKLAVKDGAVEIAGKALKVPAMWKDHESVYIATAVEAAMSAQSSDDDKSKGRAGLDINYNNSKKDSFLMMAVKLKDSEDYAAIVDVDANGIFSAAEQKHVVVDFNKSRMSGLQAPYKDMVEFSASSPYLAYPLLFEKSAEGELEYLTLGAAFGSHGTHVASIAAADGPQIKGAAPGAKIMAHKVCGDGCSDAAILRALTKAFNNESGLIPDVVNISLGSHQQYNQDVTDHLMRDLAAKYGTAFFISASNSGPGYRSINGIGSFGPVIQVAAHASKEGMMAHYNLREGVDIPEQNLLSFTSLGPSYTGLMRPNIAAPGSAVAATPMANGQAQMMQGTSMSSPLAAGAAAALLSVAKTNPAMKPIYDLRAKKIELVKANTPNQLGSLVGIPQSLRAALQETAFEMQDYTVVHQGYGLINVDRAYDEFVRIANRWVKDEIEFFEVSLNGDTEKGRVYDRSTEIKTHKYIDLELVTDQEHSEAEKQSMQITPITVTLERVQVQKSDGSMVNITDADEMPFYIAHEGVEGQRNTSKTMALVSGVKKRLTSGRDLEKMEMGTTYVAHYTGLQNGQRVFSFVDIVHMPYVFSNITRTETFQGNKISLKSAFSLQNQSVRANGMHRIPIAVPAGTTSLKFSLGMSVGETGRVFAEVYDPNGRGLLNFEYVTDTPQQPGAKKNAEFVVSTYGWDKEKGKGKEGIYELTLSATSARWMAASKYDLLVEAIQFKPEGDSIDLATHARVGATSTVFTITNTDHQIPNNIAASFVSHKFVAMMPDVEVKPHHWSYQKIELPKTVKEGKLDLTVVMTDSKKNAGLYGRVHHQLFKLEGENKFVPIQGPNAVLPNPNASYQSGSKSFKGVEITGQSAVYFAIETAMIFPVGTENISKASPVAEVAVLFDNVEVPKELHPNVSIEKAAAPNKAIDVFELTVSVGGEVPDFVKAAEAGKAMPAILSIMQVVVPGMPGLGLNIPVTTYQ